MTKLYQWNLPANYLINPMLECNWQSINDNRHFHRDWSIVKYKHPLSALTIVFAYLLIIVINLMTVVIVKSKEYGKLVFFGENI